MSDYKERFEKWQKDAKEKFEEIDKQFGLKDKIGEGAKAVVETAKKGAETIKTEAGRSDVGALNVKRSRSSAPRPTSQSTVALTFPPTRVRARAMRASPPAVRASAIAGAGLRR